MGRFSVLLGGKVLWDHEISDFASFGNVRCNFEIPRGQIDVSPIKMQDFFRSKGGERIKRH
jgi:hypothetical protein